MLGFDVEITFLDPSKNVDVTNDFLETPKTAKKRHGDFPRFRVRSVFQDFRGVFGRAVLATKLENEHRTQSHGEVLPKNILHGLMGFFAMSASRDSASQEPSQHEPVDPVLLRLVKMFLHSSRYIYILMYIFLCI